MTLYPYQPFTEGDIWSPELAFLTFNQVFDDQTQYLGHYPRLTDDSLSNVSGNIKARVSTITDSLKVTVESGLTLRYASGVLRLPNGDNTTKATSLVVAPDNSTSYVWADADGVITCGLVPPVIRCLLAKVTTVSGTVTLLEDLRSLQIRQVQPIAASIKTFGGSNPTDKTCDPSEVFDQGLYYFRNFTVPAGVSITIDKYARIFCSGNVNIQGTVNITTIAQGAGSYGTSAISGLNQGGISGAGAGAGSGSSVTGGQAYNFAAQPYGSGGGLGFGSGASGTLSFGGGGRGGGGLWVEASGTITVGSSASIVARGGNAGNSSATGTALMGGNGGGSGGFIHLASLTSVTVDNGSTLDVRGGNGSAAVNPGGSNAWGGGAGGGGVIVISAPVYNTSGANFLIAPGTNGADVGTGTQRLGGGNGGGFGGNGAGGGDNRVNASNGKIYFRQYVPLGS